MKKIRKFTCIIFLMSLILLPIISFADQKDNVVSDDDIKDVVMEFIKGPFSVDKPVSEFSMIDSREEDFIYYINKRVDIINERISAFDNEVHKIKFEFKDWNIERLIDNTVVVNVYVSSEFNYIDNNIQSSSGINYTVYLNILDNNILVKDALSDDPWSQFFERDFGNLEYEIKPMSDFNSIKNSLEIDRSKIDELFNNEKENIVLELKAASFSNLDKKESTTEDYEIMPRATLRSLDRNSIRTYIRNWANGRNPAYVDLTRSGGGRLLTKILMETLVVE